MQLTTLTIFSNTAFSIIGAALTFVTSVLAARILGPEDFGLASYILSISGLLTVICGFGYQFKLPKSQHNYKVDEIELNKANSLSIVALISCLPIVLLISDHININKWTIILTFLHAALFILVDQIYFYHNAAGKRFTAVFHKSILSKLIPFIAVALVAIITTEITPGIYISLLVIGFLTVIIINHGIIRLRRIYRNDVKDIGVLYLVQILYFVPSFGLRILYVEIATLTALAYLTLGLMITQIINLFSTSICNQLAPDIRTSLNDQKYQELQKLLQKSSFYPTLLMLTFLIILFYNFNYIISFLGKEYNADTASLIIYCVILGAVFNTATGATGTILMLSKYANLEIYTGMFKALTTVTTFMIIQLNHPVLSVPISLATGELAANVIKHLIVKKQFNINSWSRYNLAILSISSACLTITGYALSKTTLENQNILFIHILLSIFIIILSLLAYNRND